MPRFLFASTVINEVLFDPSGTDTGLERIEIYNPDETAADMSGWELYPDGIGYFVFPAGFLLSAKSFVVVHLRSSGANDASNLYHSSADANMGNSSGSVVLFKVGSRGKDTIVDFVRYHKAGASERKTWESAAVEAGLWPAGNFVDIAAHTEGSSIGLVSDGMRGGPSSWKIYANPSLGSANGGSSGGPPPSPLASPPPPPAEAGLVRAITPSLGADAGLNITALAGAVIPFRGMAFGLDGGPLTQARFLWNFGDGSFREGRSVVHVYYFPGTYRVNLVVSSGEYIGSDWLTATVLPVEVYLSEIAPSDDGFVELFNAADQEVDIGGMELADNNTRVFRLPVHTVVAGRSAAVFPNAVSGLNPTSWLKLSDARGKLLEEVSLTENLTDGASWERRGKEFFVQLTPTPGSLSFSSSAGATAASESSDAGEIRRLPATSSPAVTLSSADKGLNPAAGKNESETESARDPDNKSKENLGDRRRNAAALFDFSSSTFFLIIAAAGSAAAAAVIVFLRRKKL